MNGRVFRKQEFIDLLSQFRNVYEMSCKSMVDIADTEFDVVFNYVTNRVQKIRSCTHPHQWHYVHVDRIPADKGTRTLPASNMSDSTWT
jgi:hypothetical protein